MKRSNLLSLCVMIICIAFAVVLVLSEAFVARHECMDDHCALCAISVSFKFVFFASVCAFLSLTYAVDVPRVESNDAKCLTPVSSKAKLTI